MHFTTEWFVSLRERCKKIFWKSIGPLLQAFREEIAPLRQDVRVVNELSAELTPLDIQLSSTASRQLDQLNMRWKLLQVIKTPWVASKC